MTFTLNISASDLAQFEAGIRAKLEGARQPVQSAMADSMLEIVQNNFGSAGLMRPFEWQALSPAYAKKVGRSFATLYVSGALKDTVQKDDANQDAAAVTMSNTGLVPYALAHHHGNPGNFGFTTPGSGELPARRVFPMDPASEEVTPEAVEVVLEAAKGALKGAFA